MSAYHQYATQFEDQACTVQALQDVSGYKAIVHDKAQPLYDYVGKKRPETAEIVVPRNQINGAANDIGFKKQANGTFQAIISEYDRGHHNEQWLNKVKQAYSVRRGIGAAEKRGFTVTSQEVTKDNLGRPKTIVRFARAQAKA